MTDPIIRANQWKQALEGEGGIREILDDIRMEYFTKAGKLDHLAMNEHAAALHKLALASRIVDMVEDHIRSYIDDGKLAQNANAFADKIASLPERKRRWLSVGGRG